MAELSTLKFQGQEYEIGGSGEHSITAIIYHGEEYLLNGGGASLVLTGLIVSTPPDTYEYEVGSEITYAGMVLTALYEDGYSRDVTDLAEYSIPKGTVLDHEYEGSVVFTYTEGSATETTSITITVSDELSWANSSCSKLAVALQEAYAGDESAIANLAVGDERRVQMLDGTYFTFVLLKKAAYDYYLQSGSTFTNQGKTKFAVGLKEAYPLVKPEKLGGWGGGLHEHYIPTQGTGDLSNTTFYDNLPADFKALFKLITGQYKSSSSNSVYTARYYTHFLYPLYLNYTSSTQTVGSNPPKWPSEADDDIRLYASQGGYYDANTIDTSQDVFSQSNRPYKNVYDPTQYVEKVVVRGAAVSAKNTSYGYDYMDAVYNCITNKGTVAAGNTSGLTFLGAI